MQYLFKQTDENHPKTAYDLCSYLEDLGIAAELLEQFEIVKTMSKGQTNAYNYVKGWFVKQFPDYKALPDFTSGKLNVTVLTAEQWEKNSDKAA